MISAASVQGEAKRALEEFNRGNTHEFDRVVGGLVTLILSPAFERHMEAVRKVGFHVDLRKPADAGNNPLNQIYAEMLLTREVPYKLCLHFYRGERDRGLYLDVLRLYEAMKIIADRSQYLNKAILEEPLTG